MVSLQIEFFNEVLHIIFKVKVLFMLEWNLFKKQSTASSAAQKETVLGNESRNQLAVLNQCQLGS